MSQPLVNSRVVAIAFLSMAIAGVAALLSRILLSLISFFTNLFFFGKLTFSSTSPADHQLGLWVIAIPILGGLIVGWMARYGSKAIRGHGIPEAMEQILINESRIPARIVILKPLSAAISIGTGGPFGAEGPIIATGGALGSLVGQIVPCTALERKVLLASGAAAGMTATFGTPISAVLLAVELLLFEWRPRSLIPVSLAAATAAAARVAMGIHEPFFKMPTVTSAGAPAMVFYALMGALIGVIAIGVTRWVYFIEDEFERRLRIHWMWWPALGGIIVGLVGYFSPATLGVGYENIERALSGNEAGLAMLAFCGLKFVSWSVSLGSGTSGGTLAPLMTVGGGLGALMGFWTQRLFPALEVDAKIAALIGMAGLFSGCSRTLLTSVVFAFEATRQPESLVPLLAGCAAAYFVSCRTENSIMTEKIARRGVHVPVEYLSSIS